MVSPTLSCCEHSLNTMRYADRVKELGAADPAAGRNENGQRLDEEGNGHIMESEDSNGVMLAMRDDGVLSPEDSDLAQLRSLNEGELSADWYNFQVKCNLTPVYITLVIKFGYQVYLVRTDNG